MKISSIIGGPYVEGCFIWLVCEVTDGRGNFWSEEVYYDTVEDANADFAEISEQGIDLYEEFLDEDEEERLE
mgnify:CR=1 FL=1